MKRTLALITLLIAGNVFAYPIYSGIFPDTGDLHLLVHIRDKACDPKNGNANIVSTSKNLRGCWTQDGQVIRISVLDSDEVKVFLKSEFKYMGEIQESSAAKQEESKSSSVTLTCVADAWVGDVLVERNSDGSLRSVFVSGDKVEANEQVNVINFSFKGLNISLSTLTGVFNYETTGFQSFLNNQMRRSNPKGAGRCVVNNSQKKF